MILCMRARAAFMTINILAFIVVLNSFSFARFGYMHGSRLQEIISRTQDEEQAYTAQDVG